MRGKVMGWTALLAAVGVLAGTGPTSAQAEVPVLPWLGCWLEVGAPADAAMTCMAPDGDGVALLTVTRAGVIEREVLRLDGVAYPTEGGGCEGQRVVEPSEDGSLLFLATELECEGGTRRDSKGLIAMLEPDRWVRIRALETEEGWAAWSKHYRPAPESRLQTAGLESLEAVLEEYDLALEAARLAAAASPSVDDIIAASGRTAVEVVKTWLAEKADPVRLDADALVRMADAGVAEEVIDVAIAVSYPDHFRVGQHLGRTDRARRGDRYGDRSGYGPTGWWPYIGRYGFDPFWYPYGYGRWSRYGHGLGYGFGYGLGTGYGYGPGVVVVQPIDIDDDETGRVIKGRGYTRSRGTVEGPRTTRRPAPSVGSRRGWSSGSSGSGSSGSARSSGSSSGESKGKAKPKGGGG